MIIWSGLKLSFVPFIKMIKAPTAAKCKPTVTILNKKRQNYPNSFTHNTLAFLNQSITDDHNDHIV